MAAIREKELWALAIWVERQHSDESEQFIAGRVRHFDAKGDIGGKQLWMDVARRYSDLKTTKVIAPN